MYDVAVIGSGIVGLSTALALLQKDPHLKIIIIEKEKEIGTHQTGNNSGVIHSGIYYKPGSLKARLAKKGNEEMIKFCKAYGIEFEQCGKLIVAKEKSELPLLENLYKRGIQNNLTLSRVSREEIAEREPYLRGIEGINVPSTGIVNFRDVAKMFEQLVKQKDAEVQCSTEVQDFVHHKDYTEIQTNNGLFQAKVLINCTGLFSDRVAELDNVKTNMKIIPFRGEYYELSEEKRHLVNKLIYPVPNPDFPFLGVHFTKMIDGRVTVGPNAVLGMKREGYKKTDFSWKDSYETLSYPGFWKVASGNITEGMKEMVRSIHKKTLVKELQKFIPAVEEKDLLPSKAGVRAQAIDQNGNMIDDFFIVKTRHAVHVCNAPSPAATASIEIGRYIANQVKDHAAIN
ncbi:L-2-hydroxyglutarate oxidase [Alteribacillus sp. HJP-4]|uniref:L-2-hydroxyglutarate oxidase n=1 Tax=Alteribacillus sp. HJP-4 TaxID=2775394 RepID=UPI0035CCEC09